MARNAWFHIPEKFPFTGRIYRKTVRVLFRVLYGTIFVTRLQVTANVLWRLHCFHPLVDIPQICPTWVTFAEGCTVFQLSTSERLRILCRGISNGGTWMPIILFLSNIAYSPGGATIGSQICTGTTLHQCRFSSFSFVFLLFQFSVLFYMCERPNVEPLLMTCEWPRKSIQLVKTFLQQVTWKISKA